MRVYRPGIWMLCLGLCVFFVIGCSNPNVTIANFQRIERGMTRADVIQIMGKPDDEDSGGGGIAGFVRTGSKLKWRSGGRKIIVAFVENEVLLKLKKGF